MSFDDDFQDDDCETVIASCDIFIEEDNEMELYVPKAEDEDEEEDDEEDETSVPCDDMLQMTEAEREAYNTYIAALKNYSGDKVCGVRKTRIVRW
jgi:hypothetical protein